MQLIDTHAHLDDEQFAADRDAVIQRAQAAGVTAVLAVGTTLQTSRQAVRLAGQYPIVHAAVGVHPNYAAAAAPEDWDQLVELSSAAKIVAIGETGLDRFRTDTPFSLQVEYFMRHCDLARQRGLPLVIHCRDAEADLVEYLSGAAHPWQGVMHSFTGGAATAARCVELGLHISFAGQITYTNRKFDALREVARLVPPDRLLVETDSPYLAPEPHRGQRNEPAHVSLVAARLAAIRGLDNDELARVTTANARRLFQLA
jgi:TatD DNase family protein